MLAVQFTWSGHIPDYTAALNKFVRWASRKIRSRMREKMSESKSGANYYKGKGSGFKHYHRSSAPGESPANDTFAYSKSLEIADGDLESKLTTDLPYPYYLEKGTDRIQPRPMWHKTVVEMLPTLETDLRLLMEQA